MKVYGKEIEVYADTNIYVSRKYVYVLKWNGEYIICSKIDKSLTDAKEPKEYVDNTYGWGTEGPPKCLIKHIIIDKLKVEKANNW